MLKGRINALRKSYNKNARKIYRLCTAPNTPAERLTEFLPILDKICATAWVLCVELSKTTANPVLLREAVRLDRAWDDLRALVEAAILRRTAKAA
ncbi:hypothetical protein [Hoeflea sp. IMCC20628]|uniref:hypothetical protein n=1 Tax=Hoeflea sp. IMCC20628 TaxID=1620421 RepID=UPI0012E0329A|nr:hypothetical protein [Hoeflea sp. IMCC20628]